MGSADLLLPPQALIAKKGFEVAWKHKGKIFGASVLALMVTGSAVFGVKDRPLVETTNDITVDTDEMTTEIQYIDFTTAKLCQSSVEAHIENVQAELRTERKLIGFIPLPTAVRSAKGTFDVESTVCIQPTEVTGAYDPSTDIMTIDLSSEDLSIETKTDTATRMVTFDGNYVGNSERLFEDLSDNNGLENTPIFEGAIDHGQGVDNFVENVVQATAEVGAAECTSTLIVSEPAIAAAWGGGFADSVKSIVSLAGVEPETVLVSIDGTPIYPMPEAPKGDVLESGLAGIEFGSEEEAVLQRLLNPTEDGSVGELSIDSVTFDGENTCSVSAEVLAFIDNLDGGTNEGEQSSTEAEG